MDERRKAGPIDPMHNAGIFSICYYFKALINAKRGRVVLYYARTDNEALWVTAVEW